VEVVTGYVQSKILRHGLHAPSDSLYLPIKEHIENIKNSGNRDGMSGLAYAKSVVDQVTKPTPPNEIWEGAGARQLWLIVTWLPQWLKVCYFWSE
jgi:1-acylglycerone phosphate reductase